MHMQIQHLASVQKMISLIYLASCVCEFFVTTTAKSTSEERKFLEYYLAS